MKDYSREELLSVLASYKRMIDRDNGEHPTAVLDDISKSIDHVLNENGYVDSVFINSLVGKTVQLTERVAQTYDKKYIAKDEYYEHVYESKINSVEDRGDYYYIGHQPVDFRNGRFGYFRFQKTGKKMYGVVEIKEIQ